MQYVSVYALIDFVSLLLKCAPDMFRTLIYVLCPLLFLNILVTKVQQLSKVEERLMNLILE